MNAISSSYFFPNQRNN